MITIFTPIYENHSIFLLSTIRKQLTAKLMPVLFPAVFEVTPSSLGSVAIIQKFPTTTTTTTTTAQNQYLHSLYISQDAHDTAPLAYTPYHNIHN